VSPTAAIALLALRNALRSRVLLVLAGLLFAVAFLLPLAMRGDGTPEGLIRLHLSYTLGIASFLLALSTLWAGCAAISQEADDKTLQLLLVKPVPRLRIWLGKWIALLLVDALLLGIVGAAAAATLHAKLRRAGFDPAALAAARLTTLAALDTLRAPLPDVEADLRAEYESLRARRALPPNASETAVLDSLRRALLARRYSIAPRGTLAWTFDLPPAPPGAPRSLAVQVRADSSVPGAPELLATLDLRAGDARLSRELRAVPGTFQTLFFHDLPADAARASVVVSNRDPHNATLFFDPADGLVLRHPAGTFAGNYLRALGRLYLRLALFAAIGVTLGTLFSMPVATFLTLVLILVLQLSGFISAAAQVDRESFVAKRRPLRRGRPCPRRGRRRPAGSAPSFAARADRHRPVLRLPRHLPHPPPSARRPHARRPLHRRLISPPATSCSNVLQQALVLPLLLALLSAAVLQKTRMGDPFPQLRIKN
jgi:hypothetical protein